MSDDVYNDEPALHLAPTVTLALSEQKDCTPPSPNQPKHTSSDPTHGKAIESPYLTSSEHVDQVDHVDMERELKNDGQGDQNDNAEVHNKRYDPEQEQSGEGHSQDVIDQEQLQDTSMTEINVK